MDSANPPQDAPSKIYRHETLYFEDGDVVISAQDATGCRVLFRVDKRSLARQSSVFESLFSLPTHSGLNEEYNGAPMAHLDEKAEALQDLLSFMYNPA